jgi:dipeptidyl aminopeptidase/acylaminoacyl peptidase
VNLAHRGGAVAFAASTPLCPAEIYVANLGGGAPRRLTTTNAAIDAVRLSTPEVVRWRAADGLEIEGILTPPLARVPDQRAPLVVLVHGGPESCHRNGWNTTPSYPAQLLAARGYAVLMPNYRGSIGRDESFERADHGDLMAPSSATFWRESMRSRHAA